MTDTNLKKKIKFDQCNYTNSSKRDLHNMCG